MNDPKQQKRSQQVQIDKLNYTNQFLFYLLLNKSLIILDDANCTFVDGWRSSQSLSEIQISWRRNHQEIALIFNLCCTVSQSRSICLPQIALFEMQAPLKRLLLSCLPSLFMGLDDGSECVSSTFVYLLMRWSFE